MGSPILFILLAAVAIGAALGMLTSRNAVHSALYLVLNFATVAVLYIVLNAPFIAMVQITVYAGAIIVLFLFVIMLLGAERLRGAVGDVPGLERFHRVFAIVLAVALLVTIGVALFQGVTEAPAAPMIDTSPAALGMRLFEGYILPFELTGVLLLAAMIGVAVLSIRKKRGENA